MFEGTFSDVAALRSEISFCHFCFIFQTPTRKPRKSRRTGTPVHSLTGVDPIFDVKYNHKF